MPTLRLVWGFNALLMYGKVPEAWAKGRTTLIPKKPRPEGPGDYRPITVTSLLLRTLNKILAARCLSIAPLPNMQKGFAMEEGVASNLLLIQRIVQSCTSQNKNGIVAFLDFRKAFDSISHESLIRAAGRWGLPEMMICYIKDLYSKAGTSILGEATPITRGVLQGDPLSPFLFNITLDWVLSELSPAPGIKVGNDKISYIAYADDVALLASTISGMQEQLDRLTRAGRAVGLELGPAKCATVSIKGDKKRKKWYVDARHKFRIGEENIKALQPTETYKYLGLEIGPVLRNREPAQALAALVEELTTLQKAPLKPQQKFWAVKHTTFARHIYRRVLGRSKQNLLKRMDLELRKFLRSALHLPKDTPNSHFYANTADGGLGIPSFTQEVEVLRKAMRERLLESSDRRVREAATTLLEEGTLSSKELKARNRRRNREDWYATTDGAGLKEAKDSPNLNNWVDSGTKLMRGSKYVTALKIRSGTACTRLRAARGRPNAPILCDKGCRRVESLGHILQTCPVLAPERTSRHDRVLDLAVNILKKKPGNEVQKEPSIRTTAGLRRPDIIVYNGQRSTVMDVQITSDSTNSTLAAAHELKTNYYNNEEISRHTRDATGHPPSYSSITISWRGVMAQASYNTLKTWGLTNEELTLLFVRSLEGSAMILGAHRDVGGHGAG